MHLIHILIAAVAVMLVGPLQIAHAGDYTFSGYCGTIIRDFSESQCFLGTFDQAIPITNGIAMSLAVFHPRIGTLDISLHHTSSLSSANATIWARQCPTTYSMYINFKDGYPDPNTCPSTNETSYANLSPTTSFRTAFNGRTSAGNWTLKVADSGLGNWGDVRQWTITILAPTINASTAIMQCISSYYFTIRGSGFVEDSGKLIVRLRMDGGNPLCMVTSVTSTEIVCWVENVACGGRPVYATVELYGGLASEETQIGTAAETFVTVTPSPNNTIMCPTLMLGVRGTNFSPVPSNNRVTLYQEGGSPSCTVWSSTSTSIACYPVSGTNCNTMGTIYAVVERLDLGVSSGTPQPIGILVETPTVTAVPK